MITPTVQDVVGRPLPGSGLAPRPSPLRAVAFRGLMEQALYRTLPNRAPGTVPEVRRAAIPRPTAAAPFATFGPRRGTRPGAPPARRGAAAAMETAPKAGPRSAERTALRGAIRTSAAHAGVEPALSVAIARAESSLDPRAVSPDGISVGTFQVTHATKAEMRRKFAAGIVERPPGDDDVALGIGYLDYLERVFRKDTGLTKRLATDGIADPHERRRFVTAAFNAGEGRVAGAQVRARALGLDPTRFENVRRFLPPITQAYVDRVQRYRGEESAAAVDAIG